MIAETIALNRIFEDDTLRKALLEFFEHESIEEMKLSAEAMGMDSPMPELARKHACYAKAYEEAIHRLRAYAKQV